MFVLRADGVIPRDTQWTPVHALSRFRSAAGALRKRGKKLVFSQLNLKCYNHSQTELPQDVDIDLDEILDIEDENQRKKFIRVSIKSSGSNRKYQKYLFFRVFSTIQSLPKR